MPSALRRVSSAKKNFIKKAAAHHFFVQRLFAILLCTLCALNSGGSGGSSHRRSSLGRCSLRGSGLAGSSLRRSSLGNSGACRSSLRGGGSSGSRTASGHTSSQSQSNNSDANILEFHINDLLSLLVNVLQRAFMCASLRCYILVRFKKKSRGFWSKVIIHVKNLHSCHKVSPKVKDFLAKIKPRIVPAPPDGKHKTEKI